MSRILYTVCEENAQGAIPLYRYLFNWEQVLCYAVQKEYEDSVAAKICAEARGYKLIAKKSDSDSPFLGLSEKSCVLRENECEAEVEITDDIILADGGAFKGVVMKGYYYSSEWSGFNNSTKEYERAVLVGIEGDLCCTYLHSVTEVFGSDGEESDSTSRVDCRLERK